MKQSETPLWKKSMLRNLNLSDILFNLDEISENGDPFGYENDYLKKSEYYEYYEELFNELSAGAYDLSEAIMEFETGLYYDFDEKLWDIFTVGLLGERDTILGYDPVQEDYYNILDPESFDLDLAVKTAEKKILKMTKADMLRCFRTVLVTLICYFDLKSAHDCLTAVVTELEERGAILVEKNNQINNLYKDLTGANGEEFDRLIKRIPQRMWVE